MIAIFQQHRSIIDSGVNLALDWTPLLGQHRSGMQRMAYIPLAAHMLRRIRSGESCLSKFRSFFQDSVSISSFGLFVKGIAPGSNFANLGAVLGGKGTILEHPVNSRKNRFGMC